MIYLIIVAAMIVAFVLAMRYVKKIKNIPRLETQGTITKVIQPRGKGEEPTFCFSYSVEGKEYNAMVNSLGGEGLDKNTAAGTKVIVLYDPNRPADAYCKAIK